MSIINGLRIAELGRDPAALIALLQEWGVIANSVGCQVMTNILCRQISSWMVSCGHAEMQHIRIGVRKELDATTEHWVTYTEITTIMEEVSISQRTATDWNSYCREVMINSCFTNSKPIGGPGKTVEIDESKFGRRKYYRGHAVEGQWVFGGVERERGEFFLCPVEQRDAATLVPIIQSWILPGTTVISDCWRSYNILKDLEFQHLTVKHSTNFVDPVTGANTNTVESLWRHAQYRMPHYHRVKEFFLGYLAKFMFLNRVRRQHLDSTVEFMKAAGSLYNPNMATNSAFMPSIGTESDSD